MPDLKKTASISIVVPFHNEESNIIEMYGRLHAVMEGLRRDYQFVFVDDGSSDATYKLLKEVALIDPHATIVKLRRNFGQTAALAAGFAHTTGEYVIAMDGDLQHDPSDIPIFLEKIEEGYDVVSGWRSHRIDNLWLRKIPSRCANWLMAKLSGVHIHDFGTTFKAYRGDLLRQLPLYGEMHRFIPALASAHGASICEIPIQNTQRRHGVSHYDLSRTFRVMFDLITIRFLLRYMTRPLHFFGRLGLINMGLGSTVALWLLIWKIVAGIDVVQQHGLLLVFAAVLILAGLQLMALGLLGELQVWQYFNPSARRPYAVSDVVEARSVARASTVGVGLDDRNGVARKEKGHEGAPTLHPSADLSEQDLEIHEQAVEQAITELGEDASLNDVVARVRSIKDALAQSPARRKGEPLW